MVVWRYAVIFYPRGFFMKLTIKCDEKVLDIKITIAWSSTINLFKVLVPLAAAMAGLLAAPQIGHLGALFGWW